MDLTVTLGGYLCFRGADHGGPGSLCAVGWRGCSAPMPLLDHRCGTPVVHFHFPAEVPHSLGLVEQGLREGAHAVELDLRFRADDSGGASSAPTMTMMCRP